MLSPGPWAKVNKASLGVNKRNFRSSCPVYQPTYKRGNNGVEFADQFF